MHRHILIKDASSAEASPAAAKVNSPSSKAITLSSAASLKGELTIPGDKSISHRAIMFSSLAKGDTQITHFLESADCLATMDCFSRLGIYIERDFSEHGKLIVHGTGLRGLYPSHSPIALYSQNSGTTTRIMSGILAPQHFTSYITGDESVNRRPMKRVMEPLQQMGADIVSMNDDNCAPLKITGKPLHGITWKTSVASAQVKSAILCAGLYAEGNTTVLEPAISRDHTEKMLAAFGHVPAVTDLTDGSGKFAGHSVSVTPARLLFRVSFFPPAQPERSLTGYISYSRCHMPRLLYPSSAYFRTDPQKGEVGMRQQGPAIRLVPFLCRLECHTECVL